MLAEEVLQKYWGYSSFRPLQKDIVESVISGKDTLALLPTGGGKSICFQVPALMKPGLCLVISPLIALMNDQVANLEKKGIKAFAITSGMTHKEIDVTLDNCIYGDVKFLYVSPERLASDLFKVRLERMKLNLIAVDEAHCISQWGYDFRPSYIRIAEIREIAPGIPVLALTATATPEVVDDIQEKLQFPSKNVFQKSFSRKNLAYLCFNEENKYARLLRICNSVKGSGIVYVRNRRRTQDVATLLFKSGISADYYHAGLGMDVRSEKQKNWIENKIRVIVCTNAFGMGIDKPDVSFVVHLDLPDSPEAYFQEAGRAGRNEEKAYATILWDNNDLKELSDNIERSFPAIDDIKRVYQAIGNYLKLATGAGEGQSFKIDLNNVAKNFDFQPSILYNALKFLEREGLLAITENSFEPSKILFRMSYEDLYNFQVFNKNLDPFIRQVLRSCPGAFTHAVRIREREIAKQLGIKEEQVITFLETLDKKEVLTYYQKTELPVLTFLVPRLEQSRLKISPENYQQRKEIAQKRAKAMLTYVTEKEKCRSEILLHYFGESNTEPCGVCDTCLAKMRSKTSSSEFDALAEKILSDLQQAPVPYIELVGSFSEADRDKAVSVIRLLIDQQKVILNEKQELRLK